MKKLLIWVVVALAGSCTPLTKKSEPEENKTYIINKSSPRQVTDERCDYENLPRFPNRPKLNPRELSKMTEAEMDVRIKQHIKNLERHIDTLESVIVRTRNRFDQCR